MVHPCDKPCGNKTGSGYCATTACINPQFSNIGTAQYGKGVQKALDIIRQAIPETVQSLRDIVNDANVDATTRVRAASLLRRYLVVLAQLESEVFDG